MQDWLVGESTVDEMMADPIVQLMMRSDGVTADEIWQLVKTVSAHLRERRQHLAEVA